MNVVHLSVTSLFANIPRKRQKSCYSAKSSYFNTMHLNISNRRIRTNHSGHKLKKIFSPFTACLQVNYFPHRSEIIYNLPQIDVLLKLDNLRTNSSRISNVIPCFLSIKMYWYAIFIFHSSPTSRQAFFHCFNGATFNFILLSRSNYSDQQWHPNGFDTATTPQQTFAFKRKGKKKTRVSFHREQENQASPILNFIQLFFQQPLDLKKQIKMAAMGGPFYTCHKCHQLTLLQPKNDAMDL